MTKTQPNWRAVHQAAFGNPYEDEPQIAVVSARYGGCYEGGLFVAVPAEALGGPAFGQDRACAEWWDENGHRCGVGNTPDEALADWYEKREERK